MAIKILLCRRAIEPRHGFWTLPAGFLENGESSLQGALRECEEEANAQVIEPSYTHFSISHRLIRSMFSIAQKLAEPKFNPTFESSEVALFDEADIPWSELAFPVVELALHHFLSDRQSGNFVVRHDEIQRPWKSPRSIS